LVKVNGQALDNAAGISLSDFLKREGYDLSRIAVEYNDDIIAKFMYATKIIEDGDALEIVGFVGGG
jgi:sulfur carrier protein